MGQYQFFSLKRGDLVNELRKKSFIPFDCCHFKFKLLEKKILTTFSIKIC